MAAAVVLGGGQLAMADYSAYISASSPVAWWGMNEGASAASTPDLSGAYGAANNQAGVNLDQTYQNVDVDVFTGAAGFAGAGMSAGNKSTYFDGAQTAPTAQGLGLASAYAHATGPISSALPGAIYHYDASTSSVGLSAEVWMKADGVQTTLDSERFFGVREFALGFESNYGVSNRLHFTTFGKQDYFSTAVFPTDGGWHQIALSWDATTGTAEFYIDGVSAGSQAGAVGLTPASPTSINNQMNLAMRAGGQQPFKGWLDEVVIWNTVRSAADVAASYLAATSAPWAFIPGDFNKDGEVGPEDFGILKDNFGIDGLPFGAHQSWTLGDANDDGEIGPEDFGLLKDNFGIDGGPTGTYPLTNAPEPTTMALLALGAVGLIRRRRTA
ncbi:MAG: PEP-CTERM sorting domain-containing protein [Planctomycetota bacterium]|nr:PEP-CTERM sorting domain-containing protein [Planctomycetota bacterium]